LPPPPRRPHSNSAFSSTLAVTWAAPGETGRLRAARGPARLVADYHRRPIRHRRRGTSGDRRGVGVPVSPSARGSGGLPGSCSGSHAERAGGTVPWFPSAPRGPLRAGRPAGLVPSPPAGRLASPSACGSGTAPRLHKPARIRGPPNGYPIAAGAGSQGLTFPTGSRAPALHGGPAHEA
jgi:hypothetical protein